MKNTLIRNRWLHGVVLGTVVLLAGCERPPVDSVQHGYRGTAMVQVYNPRALESDAAHQAAPEIAPPARVREGAPKAGAVYKNVQVLGEVSLAEFGRTMNAITAWVSPQQSCAYCHVADDFADDAKYTKIVARRMIQMVRHINGDWRSHVGETGVTCYTCHRGNPLPAQVWFRPGARPAEGRSLGYSAGQNTPAPAATLASLPSDPFSHFLLPSAETPSIRVLGTRALPSSDGSLGRPSTKQAEFTYALMLHMSNSLGVNCTYCHNSRSFAAWDQSSPQRGTAWYGIRMVRNLNAQYLEPLNASFPPVPVGRLGPTGDSAKLHCATCHQGSYKPLYGAQTAKHYPALVGSTPIAAATASAATATEARAIPPAEAAASAAVSN